MSPQRQTSSSKRRSKSPAAGFSDEAKARISKSRTQQSKTGPVSPRQSDPAEGERERVEKELKRQREARKQRREPDVDADRVADAKLKIQRRGVI